MTNRYGKQTSIDDLVSYITLHKVNPIAFRGIVWPFVLLYLLCLGYIYQTEVENYELAFIILAIIGCCHILTVLCCYWSVHILAFLNCRKVGSNRCGYTYIHIFHNQFNLFRRLSLNCRNRMY